LSLPVLADPFWGRLLGLLTRRAEKHSKHRKFSLMPDAFVCASSAISGSVGSRGKFLVR
jgi:hypothetical protein